MRPPSNRYHPSHVCKGTSFRRIFPDAESWWYRDSATATLIRLEPVFIRCQWNVSGFADELGLATRTLSRVALDSFGIPCKTWLRRVRIVHACGALRAGHSIKATALHLGFNSPSDFAREFRVLIGLSPSEFVRLERKRAADWIS
jgi:AraC-like DNA-binding protein